MSVTWKFSLYKQSAERVKRELDSLGNSYTMHDVVEMARNEDHYMHDMFEWDDSIAGEKYRETQAQKIVRMLVYVDDRTNEPSPVRVFYSDPTETKVYAPTKLIVRQTDKYQLLLEQAIIELKAFQKKYGHLSELSEVFDAINTL